MSAELKVRFGSGAKPKSTPVVIAALNETPSNRNVRIANSGRRWQFIWNSINERLVRTGHEMDDVDWGIRIWRGRLSDERWEPQYSHGRLRELKFKRRRLLARWHDLVNRRKRHWEQRDWKEWED